MDLKIVQDGKKITFSDFDEDDEIDVVIQDKFT